ncbi:short-chain dehydrogenase [Apiospora kogelbergensis]|uniref:Short-chain dehydrogenase n=1 Tax=Apiospora kogelbergensis TaxID=1337665 RepID=A0AAW0QGE1_9PEZI
MAQKYDISPEKEGSKLQFFRRQFLETPKPVKPGEVDLTGKTALVTGCNGGVGLECCRQLRALGLSRLILAVRDTDKGQRAVDDLAKAPHPHSTMEVWKLDMSSYESIGLLVERAKSLDRIDIVVLNAAITRLNWTCNQATGHEENIQVNYLSTMLLTTQLLPVLKSKIPVQAGPSRLVIVTSDAAAWTTFPEQDEDPLLPALDKPGKIDMTNRHFTSKLMQLFFLQELANRVPPTTAIITATTPGLVHSTMSTRDLQGTVAGFFSRIALRLIGYSPEVGARQLVDASAETPSPIVYQPKGKLISERLWRETMLELSFANVEDIIRQAGNIDGNN